MDAVHFGRWLANLRRQCGFRSQRALAESILYDTTFAGLALSEDFLARLEAGNLAHPFRGSVRKRVVGLAALLCTTPRDVKAYLHAAELSKLSRDESAQLRLLQERINQRSLQTRPHTGNSEQPHKPTKTSGNQQLWLLPPRPKQLIGRELVLQELITTLCAMETGSYIITGMPGVGKSALAYEVLHMLASAESQHFPTFRDGIAVFTCTGRQDIHGLSSLLDEIIAIFGSHSSWLPGSDSGQPPLAPSSDDTEAHLATAIDSVRLILAHKQILLLLDDVNEQFPLRHALEALLCQAPAGASHREASRQNPRCIVLLTGQYIPPPMLMTHHLHLQPLEPQHALELFHYLIGRQLCAEELNYAKQICLSLGNLPLAIEIAAAAATVEAIPLPLLAASIIGRPFHALFNGRSELHSRLTQAAHSFDAEMQKQLALLPILGAQPFGLDSAAALHSSENLADTAVYLGRLIRHSFIEISSPDGTTPPRQESSRPHASHIQYRLHPLLHAHALDSLQQVEQADIQYARNNIQAYTLKYIQRYRQNIPMLQRERGVIFSSLEQAVQAEQYMYIVQSIDALALFCSVIARKDGKRLLHWGIQASQYVHDRYAQARFLLYLGWLFCQLGAFTHARQTWLESLDIAASLKPSANLWHPLFGLAHIAHVHGEVGMAQRYAQQYLENCQEHDSPVSVIVALNTLGYFARLQGDLDTAYNSASSANSLLSSLNMSQVSSLNYFFELQTLAELARVEGNYAQSKAYVDIATARMQENCDFYSLADILFDQACMAQQYGMYDDAKNMAQRLVQAAERIDAPHYCQRGLRILQQLAEVTG